MDPDLIGKEAEDYNFFSMSATGILPSDLGRECTINGKRVKIIGWKRRARRAPVIVKDVRTNARFRVEVHYVAMSLKNEGMRS